MNRYLFITTLLALSALGGRAENFVKETKQYAVAFQENGRMLYYVAKKGGSLPGDTVYFRTDSLGGLQFEQVGLTLKRKSKNEWVFEGVKEQLLYRIVYRDEGGRFCAETTVENKGSQVFVPEERVGLCLGINTYMATYPEWNSVYFPTMLRAERTHFSAYFMTPEEKILAVASPDAVASWRYNYEQTAATVQGKEVHWGGHRIFTVSLDLLHCLPLPARHPQHLTRLQPGEKRSVRLFFQPVETLQALPAAFHAMTCAPVAEAELYTIAQGDGFRGTLYADVPKRIEIRTPRGEVQPVDCRRLEAARYAWEYRPLSGTGTYTLTVEDRKGKMSEMQLYVRPDFRFYLDKARQEALRSRPTSTHHAECFYPLYTYFLAREYMPDAYSDSIAEAVYQTIFPVLFDDSVKEMRTGKYRIQDAATMAGILADRYAVTGDEKDLENAAGLVDFLIRCQGKDGGFYSGHNTHYTSVIYLAKSIMEVLEQEKKRVHQPKWKTVYQHQKAAVERALDDLARRGDDLETEGQMTFEDGMISCSVAQLAYGALKSDDRERKERYLEQALALDRKHRCLTQFLIPDARMNGATLRFWEYQYTINMMHNGMNSPCGWSAWKIYGSWYLYLLTGEYTYMRHVLNALGSCLQLLDIHTGELRFGFIPDPYIRTHQYMEIPVGSRNPVLQPVVVGEQYLSQISSWHYDTYPAWRKKWGIDNFVHEVFKCMAETVLCNAYVISRQDGSLETINCRVEKHGTHWLVKPTDTFVKHLHVNLREPADVEWDGQRYAGVSGCRWVGDLPENLEQL